MKKKIFGTVIVLLVVIITVVFAFRGNFSIAALAGAKGSEKSVEQWRVAEIELNSMKKYKNPFLDVEVKAVFNGPGSAVIEMPGFWDGGDVWKVRFAPTKPGKWSYKVYCSDKSNKGIEGKTGKILCKPYSGELSVYRHGFVRVSDSGRYFSFADGLPFFWLGDTHWGMNERLDECNYPGCGCESQFIHTVKDRLEKGFTVYQAYPSSLDQRYWLNKYDRLNPEGFKNHLDKQIDYLADRGFVIALGMGWFGDVKFSGQKGAEIFAKYMVARYAAYPVIWFTAQEVDINNPANNPAIWKYIAKKINLFDGYSHPLSGHMASGGDPKTWGEEPWHDWFATQGGHGGLKGIRTKAHYQSYWDYKIVKPFIETEAMYEGVDVGGLKATSKEVRIAAYKALLCGSYGYTYGAAGVWRSKWDGSRDDPYDHRTPWFQGIDFEGSEQMHYLRDFFTSLKWWRLLPRFNDIRWAEFEDKEQSVLASDSSKLYVAYFYNKSTKTGIIKNIQRGKEYSLQWFNPSTGEYIELEETFTPSGSRYTLPEKPDTGDWIVIVKML